VGTAARWVGVLLRVLFPVIGAAAGAGISLTMTDRRHDLWLLFAALATALTCAAGYGVERWRDMPVKFRVWPGVVLTCLVCALVFGAAIYYSLHSGLVGRRGPALLAVTLLGAAPAAVLLLSIRFGEGRIRTGSYGDQVAALLELRRVVTRLLTAFGGLVALATFALGTATLMTADRTHPLPADGVVLFGGAGTVLVALLYAPAAQAIRREGCRIRDRLFDLSGADDAATILERIDQRSRFDGLLGLGRGTVDDLRSGLVIVGPLATSAATFLLPH
jgi:hypothetical protein